MSEQLDDNWPELQIERYTGSESYFKLVEWEVVKTGGGEHAIKVQTQDEAGKPLGNVTVRHTWPQNSANHEDLRVELKDIGGGNMVYFAEVIMGGDGQSNFDSAGHGPHNIEILPGDKIYGAGLPMNEHRLYRYVMRRTVAQTQTLKQAVFEAAWSVPWMPVFDGAALWKYAKANGLQDAQTDEIPFIWQGTEYLVQVFNKGIVYAVKGDWANIKHIAK